MLEHTSTTLMLSWRACHLQHKDVLNSGVPEGQYPKAGHRFLESKSLESHSGETKKASLVLDIVYAQREVHHVERLLAKCLIREHEKIADLHRFKAMQRQGSIDTLDLDIGWIRAIFDNHGQSQSSPPLSTFTLPLPQKVLDENGRLDCFICIHGIRELTLSRWHPYTTFFWKPFAHSQT